MGIKACTAAVSRAGRLSNRAVGERGYGTSCGCSNSACAFCEGRGRGTSNGMVTTAQVRAAVRVR